MATKKTKGKATKTVARRRKVAKKPTRKTVKKPVRAKAKASPAKPTAPAPGAAPKAMDLLRAWSSSRYSRR